MNSDLPLPLQQHPCFAAALQRMGRSVRFVDVEGAAPVLAVRQFGQLITSRGPVWHRDGQGHALRAAGLRIINAEEPQDQVLRAAGFGRLMTPAHVAELDLTRTRAQRHEAMKPKWRAAWRKSHAMPLCVQNHVYDAQTHAWLLQADLAQQRAKRFRGMPHRLIGAISAAEPEAVRVMLGFQGKVPVAGMLFVLHAPVVTYHLGWTHPQGRMLCAHHRMIMEAADRFSTRGFHRLDLGLVDTETAPGLARFKIGSGADVRPLGGTWLRLPGC